MRALTGFESWPWHVKNVANDLRLGGDFRQVLRSHYPLYLLLLYIFSIILFYLFLIMNCAGLRNKSAPIKWNTIMINLVLLLLGWQS